MVWLDFGKKHSCLKCTNRAQAFHYYIMIIGCNNNYTPLTKCGGGLYWIRFVASVGQSVRRSPIRVRSITPLLMEGFPSNLNDTFTSTRGCAELMLPMCQLKVKVTVKGQIFNKQILDIMSCPLYNSFTNVRIFFKLE